MFVQVAELRPFAPSQALLSRPPLSTQTLPVSLPANPHLGASQLEPQAPSRLKPPLPPAKLSGAPPSIMFYFTKI